MVMRRGANMNKRKSDIDTDSERAGHQALDAVILESVVDGIDRMRDEGGIAPEIPHQEERVNVEAGTTNPENL
jgi:hypothetical protein